MTDASELIAVLTARGLTVAVAESLTGGLVTAALIDAPGASAVVRGGVVAYDTAIKASVLGVDEDLLRREGPVHPEVASQMASRVRDVLTTPAGRADVGVSTTGVAGPKPQGGHPPGTVYVAVSVDDRTEVVAAHLGGDRASIRSQTVALALLTLGNTLR